MERPKVKLTKDSKDGKSGSEESLHKELSVTVKVLQNLTSNLDRVNTIVSNSRNTLAVETGLKEQICRLEDQNRLLQEENHKMQSSFATSCVCLAEEFQHQSRQAEEQHQSQLSKEKARAEAALTKLRTDLASEQRKIQTSLQTERATCKDLEMEIKKINDTWKGENHTIRQRLDQTQERLVELQDRNAILRSQLDDQQTIEKGREKERDILRKSLMEYETFQPNDAERLRSTFSDMREMLDGFCRCCIENADFLPIWNRVPDGLQGKDLPLHLNMESDSGCQIFRAILKHSVVNSMLTHVFSNAPSCSCGEMNALANMLHKENPKFEAVWRRMTVNTIQKEPLMLKAFRDKLSKVANNLISSWKLVLREGPKREVHQRLTDLYCTCLNNWLALLLMSDRIHATCTGPLEYFNHDSADPPEKVIKIPGGFTPGIAHPVLCTFPAFSTSSMAEPKRKVLLFKGEAIFHNSSVLVKVIGDAQTIGSSKSQHST